MKILNTIKKEKKCIFDAFLISFPPNLGEGRFCLFISLNPNFHSNLLKNSILKKKRI